MSKPQALLMSRLNPDMNKSNDFATRIIAPGSTIGIIGGGQLGQMAALAAAVLGYKTHIYSPDSNAPARNVVNQFTLASYDNKSQLKTFAESVDVVTFEFENIPAESAQFIEAIVPVRPRWKVLEISQNRIREKTFLNEVASVPTAQFAPVRTLEDLKTAWKAFGTEKAILKTTELGYDGKGQWRISAETDLAALWQEAEVKEAILEAFVPFKAEVSAIIARNLAGEVAVYSPAENVHKNGILDTSRVPARLPQAILDEAVEAAKRIAEKLELIGLLAVEFFVTQDGKLLANEIAPRPHNSGHWTMDGAVTSQFEQFIRAVCGLPLGSTVMHSAVEMKNLIGKDVNDWETIAKNPLAKLHLYGKREAREGRKMGHVNYVTPLAEAEEQKPVLKEVSANGWQTGITG